MKQDHKRISKEKHEIAYVRKIAKEELNFAKKARKRIEEMGGDAEIVLTAFSAIKMERLCKAVLKFARYK